MPSAAGHRSYQEGVERDRLAGERDRLAGERDCEADERDRLAADRDESQDAAERIVSGDMIDLRERRALTVMRHSSAADRQQAALDRAAAAADREHARLDRRIATAERDDSSEEREILLKDELTGVLQRRAGLVEAQREVARAKRSGDPCVVAFMDVDGLKSVNDEQGHAAGDDVLRMVGGMLTARMRSYDLVMRYGGDEFLCVMPGFGIAEATARCDVLRADLAAGSPPVSVTVGLAEQHSDEDLDGLIARADASLYDIRHRARGDGNGSNSVGSHGAATAAVAAHRMLNDSAVVSMGITTLLEQWADLAEADRTHLLGRVLTHASAMDAQLKEIMRGTESLAPAL